MTMFLKVVILISLAFLFLEIRANPQLAHHQGSRANMEVLETRLVQSSQFKYKHAVTIALPASYRVQKNKKFSVLWVLDDPLMTRIVVSTVDLLVSSNMMPEMIVVGVGSPSAEGLSGVGRRIKELSPPGQGFAPSGLNSAASQKVAPFPEYPHRAEDFLSFLSDELRPLIAKEFRTSGSHILHGHSLGGLFAGYALFTRPQLFQKMIIGSPAMANVGDAVFELEKEFAKSHSKLSVDIFIGAGGAEGNEWFLNAGGILSSTARFIERLKLRNYEGLTIKSQFYTGENHYTVAPRIVSDGPRYFFREEAKKIGSSWPSEPRPKRAPFIEP